MENPGISSKDMMIAMGQMWQNLTTEDRYRYYQISEREKERAMN
jgi:hypothetical protein